MSILSSFKYKDMSKMLEHHGCYFLRNGIKGSHQIRYSPLTDNEFTVVNHGNEECPKGTFHNMLNGAGISRKMLFDYHNNHR